ncbi:MAG: polyphosphate kinase 1 [Pirellulaceae bacterium]|nr:polyphosphate kinase 1 [Pirellulaceae bacterium]
MSFQTMNRSNKNNQSPKKTPSQTVDIGPEHFINRELSWLEFNARVLEEAQAETTPLLERVKFLSIFSTNLDEFFMVRVAGLREQAFSTGAAQDYTPDQLSPLDQLSQIRKRIDELIEQQYQCWRESILPSLAEQKIEIVTPEEIQNDRNLLAPLDSYFQETIFPVITPMAIDPSHPSPRFHNRAIYLAAMLTRKKGLGPKQLFAVVQLPQNISRLLSLPNHEEGNKEKKFRFVFLEDLIAAHLLDLFSGFEVENYSTFRITRDSDLAVIEQEADDMLKMIEQRLKERRRQDAVRMEINATADEKLIARLIELEGLHVTEEGLSPPGYSEIYTIDGPIDFSGLSPLLKLPGFEEFRDPSFVPEIPSEFRQYDLFKTIAKKDLLLHHPYESFNPVIDFVSRAAKDPKVLAIKQTLYRTSGDSPMIAALTKAAENGKHVTALVELQARFDEAANVSWARKLERAGVHVVFGFLDLKTHCKVSLVVRQEEDKVRRYVHLGTGNYHPATAMTYTDIGLFTAKEAVAHDVSALFNLLTGYSQGHKWNKLIVAPKDLQRQTVELIQEQTRLAQNGKTARIFAKVNSLSDHTVITALYEASQAGVKIELVVRGICCLRPGIPGISENIEVISIVDRFLEHSRIYLFGAGDTPKVFLSSADWMPRNFYRRVEVMFPIEAKNLRKRIVHEIIPVFFQDNVKSRKLTSTGAYERIQPTKNHPPFRSQEELLMRHGKKKPPSSP